MTAPAFRRTTNTTDAGTATKYGAVDIKYWFDVMDGTHATDRIQSRNIEGLEFLYDITVYAAGTTIYARHRDGNLLTSGVFNTDDATVINTALNYSQTISPKPLTILIKPATYSLNNSLTFYSNITVYGFGATLKWTSGTTIAANPRNVSNLKIYGLTFDYNNAVSELRFEAITSQPTHGNLIRECWFKNPLGTGTSGGRLISFLNTTENWDNATNNRVINCVFDGTETTQPVSGALPLVDFSFQRNALFHGNLIENVSQWRNATILNLPNLNMVITGNVWYNNICDAQTELTIQQQKNCFIVGNVLPVGLRIIDCRDAVIVSNRIRLCLISDQDIATIPGTSTASLFRGSQKILISGNAFNSTADSAISSVGSSNSSISLDGANNDANPFKNIFIVGNSAKTHSAFFRFFGVATSLGANPHENILICNNQVLERVLVDSSTGIIQFTGNTSVTNSGLKTCIIQNNYIGTLDDNTSGGHRDIRINTTGFTNMLIRDNWFSNDGVSNIDNYPNVFSNFASPVGISASRRDSNTGTSTVGASSSTQAVNHGVAYTPTLDNIKVVPTNSMGTATRFWISNPTATQFTINVNANPGSGGATFAWHVSRGLTV